ncbi:MAG: NAD(+) synthase, partial [Eubacteriales bacterium]
ELVIGLEICEDLWTVSPPSSNLAAAGATLILNLSASNEAVGKADYRRQMVTSHSGRLVCGYVYANAGEGESSTDLVFGAHNMIAENGVLLKETRFQTGLTVSEIDVSKLSYERRRLTTFPQGGTMTQWSFPLEVTETALTRYVSDAPFVPGNVAKKAETCEEILTIAALGLKKRLEHTWAKTAVVGLSGGLDSTLAILITARAMEMLGRPMTDIFAVTMPCFGTTDRTRDNAMELADRLGASMERIDIGKAVYQHFDDIGQDPTCLDVTFENGQARERTQVLMDLANKTGGLVIGTGDLSELALGWATYNGDHMSMYAVNGSIPKTLVRHLVAHVAEQSTDKRLTDVLLDILDTPVSPELLPAINGEISQRTEDLVGPYQLHDFFIYYMVRQGFSPRKIYRLAVYAFAGQYDKDFILKWLHSYYRRFFSQQFKRSCLPDCPKVGSVTFSPRSDWRMPSDAVNALWMEELDELGVRS